MRLYDMIVLYIQGLFRMGSQSVNWLLWIWAELRPDQRCMDKKKKMDSGETIPLVSPNLRTSGKFNEIVLLYHRHTGCGEFWLAGSCSQQETTFKKKN